MLITFDCIIRLGHYYFGASPSDCVVFRPLRKVCLPYQYNIWTNIDLFDTYVIELQNETIHIRLAGADAPEVRLTRHIWPTFRCQTTSLMKLSL